MNGPPLTGGLSSFCRVLRLNGHELSRAGRQQKRRALGQVHLPELVFVPLSVCASSHVFSFGS